MLALELIYFRIGRAFHIWDLPNGRNLHETPTLRGGGIVFYFGVIAYFVFTGNWDIYFLVAISMVSIIGLLDDFTQVSSVWRLGFQSIAFAILVYGLDYPLSGMVALAFICSVAAINAFNFMDGINGITAGYGLVALGSLLYVNLTDVEFVDTDLLVTCMISVLVFAIFNFRRKAVCFAGDVGSLTLGFIIVYLMVVLIFTSGNYIYIFLLAVYGLDTLLTFVHRLLMRENVLKPHRHHLFQVVVFKTGIPHLRMTAIYMLVQLSLNITIFWTSSLGQAYPWIAGVLVCGFLVVLYIVVKKRLASHSVEG